MSIQEIKAGIAALSAEERRSLTAYLVSLRHQDLEGFRSRMARKIDDSRPENWTTLEEFDRRLEA